MHHRLLPLLGIALAACSDQGLTSFNAKPEVTIVAPADGATLDEAVTVTLEGRADDADDPSDELLATWSTGSRTLCEAVPVDWDGTTFCMVPLTAEDTEITLVVEDPAGAVGTDHVTVTVHPTGAPWVALTAPVAEGTYYSDRLVEFAGTVFDEEDAPTALTLGIVSDLDTDLAPTIDVTADGAISAWASLSEGEHTLTLWAEDTTSKRGSDSVVIVVGPPNSDPTCAITAPESGATVEQGEPVLFEAEVADPDVSADRLEVWWTSDQDGPMGSTVPGSDGQVAFPWADLSAGTHVVTMEVLDEVGGSCTDLVLVEVRSPPTITIDAPSFGSTVNQGESMIFEARVADLEDSASDLTLSWASDLDGVFSSASADASGLVRFSVDHLSVGEHSVTATVTDTDAMQAFATVEITVNGAPSAPTVGITPSVPDTLDDLVVAITSASVDPEGGAVSYGYAWYLEGSLSSASTSSTLPSSATSRGQHWAVQVTPDDGLATGPYGEATVTIGNAPPTASGVTLSPSSPTAADTLTCSWTFADPDGDADQSTVSWTIDGAWAGGGTTLSHGFARGDVVACTVTPFDGTDTGPTASASVTIGNSAPAATAVAITPSPASTLDLLTCGYSFSDADGDADLSTIAWAVGGTTAGSGATLAAGTASKGEVVSCTVTPFDGTTTGTPVSATLALGNAAPVVSTVSLTPGGPTTNSTLTASSSASDPDGDSLTTSYTWTVDGVAVAVGGNTLDGALWFDRGQTVQVSVTASDGSASSVPVASSPVTILNTPPAAPSLGFAPTAPDEGEALICVVSAGSMDDDRDSVAYRMSWTADGVPYTSTSTTTWLGDTVPAGITSATELWACTAIPNDGSDDGASATASVSIGYDNELPVVDSVRMTPSTVTTDTTIKTHITTSDADGDPVTTSFAWYVDGALVAATGSELDGSSWFDKHQTVHVVITPNDGLEDGLPYTSSNITVENSSPGAPTVAVSPADPEPGVDDLVCAVAVASTDADGDSVGYSMSWTVDGVAFAGTTTTTWPGDTVPASATGQSEVWTCTVTPNDGEDNGTAASASVTTQGPSCPLYVDAAASLGGDGSYGSPLPSIAFGLAYASLSGCDEVVLYEGTYRERVNFGGLAVTLRSESGPELTIIEPSTGGVPVQFTAGEGPDSVLEGVTITGGTVHGVYIQSSDPTIRDCIITGNSGTLGGGVFAEYYDGLFEGNTVSDNTATDGGGFYLYWGNAQIVGNTFEANSATGSGGGLYLRGAALVANNLVLDSVNHGIYLESGTVASRDYSTVLNNTIAYSSDHGVYLATQYDAGAWFYPGSMVANNIVYTSGSYDVLVEGSHPGAFSSVTWANNDVWGGGGYSHDDQTHIDGNIDLAPAFVDAPGGDFALTVVSPCIDAGQDASGYGVIDDLDGTARPQGAGYDMGAYESY